MDDREYQARVAETTYVSPLLQGAIDMHYHGFPELTLRIKARVTDMEALLMARTMGMRGIVIKSQLWPTMAQVYHLHERVSDVECFASITLNSLSGGLSPWAVDAAARQGAKVIWLPTWNAAHKQGEGGFCRMMKAWFPALSFEPALSCVSSTGEVLPEVESIVRAAKDMGLVLCTGHISPAESLTIAKVSERLGFTRLVFTHPLSEAVGATLEETKEMVKRGAYAEFCALNMFVGKNLELIPEFIAELGAAHCILTTDSFREWVPPGPEFLRMFIGRLLVFGGVDEESIRLMVRDNPVRLLGLPPKGDQAG